MEKKLFTRKVLDAIPHSLRPARNDQFAIFNEKDEFIESHRTEREARRAVNWLQDHEKRRGGNHKYTLYKIEWPD